MTTIYDELANVYHTEFQTQPTDKFFSPGRINLIGEHTDYNGGHVFPAAITLGTYGVAGKRTDKLVKLYSTNMPEAGVITFEIDDESKLPHGSFSFIKVTG